MLTVILSGYHPYLTWSLILVALVLFFAWFLTAWWRHK